MTQELSIVPQYLFLRGNKSFENIICIVTGLGLMIALAQITIQLPWSPIPITGQTFGVSLIALSWGRKRGLMVLLSYLSLGTLGLPVFANGASGIILGPTTGYLIGMVVASYIVGWLSDIGWTKTFFRTYLAATVGSLFIFSIGLLGLAFFIPAKNLLAAGLLPFLPGDLIKTILSSLIVSRTQNSFNKIPR